jgi:NDP-sugar pyrophosphorylase family protein
LLCGKSVQVDFGERDIRIDKQSSVHPQSKLVGPILIDKDCKIGKRVQLTGPIVMGAGCNIHDRASIENSVIWQNVTIGAQTVLKDCIVASNSCIDDSARIEGAVIAQAKK